MKILLCCSGGMSTSLLVAKMKKYAEEIGQNVEITATSKAEVAKYKGSVDLVLLGPQIRYAKDEVAMEMGHTVPVEVIDTIDYGMMNGKKVLDMAFKLLIKG